MATFEMRPIGRVRGGRAKPIDDDWGEVRSRVEFDPEVLEPEATAGLQEFSHVEVVFVFDQVDPASVTTGARRPRGRDDIPPLGILAQRGKSRFNRIGITTCELLDAQPGEIEVRGLDAIDGSPVLDVKPYMRGFAPRGEVREPGWASELMLHYW